MSAERREQHRVKVAVEVTLSSPDNFYAGITNDLGTGGVFVSTVAPPPVGTEVDLEVALPAGDKLRVHGVVRWIREQARSDEPPGCGIAFRDLEAGALEAIHRFVAERETLLIEDV